MHDRPMPGQVRQQHQGYQNLVRNFAARELKGRFKGSVLGWGWSLLNPLASLAVYALVFGFFLKFPAPVAGNGTLQIFAIYLFTGLVVWNLFFGVVTGSMAALVGAGPLLKKIYFPPWTPIAGNALAALAQAGIEIGLLAVVYVLFWNISWTMLLVPFLVVLLTLFALGLGLVASLWNAKLRDVNYLVSVGLNLAFYSCPIIYPISLVQDNYATHPWLQIYEWNPLVQFVQAMKDLMYTLTLPSLGSIVYLVLVSVGTFGIGMWIFERGARDVSDEL